MINSRDPLLMAAINANSSPAERSTGEHQTSVKETVDTDPAGLEFLNSHGAVVPPNRPGQPVSPADYDRCILS